ncbi:MAG: hypothetical protein LBJ00_03210 [Planctomycetaceae bacterium]|nr:hypothetical protein [Planctomycetaceae bacterium]
MLKLFTTKGIKAQIINICCYYTQVVLKLNTETQQREVVVQGRSLLLLVPVSEQLFFRVIFFSI